MKPRRNFIKGTLAVLAGAFLPLQNIFAAKSLIASCLTGSGCRIFRLLLLDADKQTFSGARVMVNMNQLGEAAGTAAFLSLVKNIPVDKLDARTVRKTMLSEGSIIFE